MTMMFLSNLSVFILVVMAIVVISLIITTAIDRLWDADWASNIVFIILLILMAFAILPRLIKWLW